MPDLGIDVLFKGTNMLRLLQGLWVAMKIGKSTRLNSSHRLESRMPSSA